MRVTPGSGMDECATHDVVFLHAPLDLTALVSRCLWFAVGRPDPGPDRLACTDIRGPDGDA